MQAHALPARQGLVWLKEGFRLWRKNPAVLSLAVWMMYLILLLCTILPAVGCLVAPPLSAGFYALCRAVDEGRPASPAMLFEGFRMELATQVRLGVLFFLLIVLVLAVGRFVDGGALYAALRNMQPDQPMVLSRQALMGLLCVLGLLVPVMMVYWFSPQLIAFWRLPALKAAVFSFVACYRNMRPFTLLVLAQFAMFVILPEVVAGILSAIHPVLGILVVLMSISVALPVQQVIGYISTRDVLTSSGASGA